MKINSEIFEFTNDEQKNKFSEYLSIIATIINNNNEDIILAQIQEIKKGPYAAIDAFKIIFSIAIYYTKSPRLIEFYSQILKSDNSDFEILEIIVDSLADIARYRSNKAGANVEDRKLSLIFHEYNSGYQSLISVIDGFVNAKMSLCSGNFINSMEKKLQLIKDFLPLMVQNSSFLISLLNDEKFDERFFNFILEVKNDLAVISSSSNSRFRSFFNPNENAKIQKMNSDQLQLYLASVVANNPNLRETKNLVKIIGDSDLYLKEISKFESEIKIAKENMNYG